jgi:excisionase family DNA binding protein
MYALGWRGKRMYAWAAGDAETDLAPRTVDSWAAARLLGVSRSTLYRLTADGAVRQIHLGRSARWLVSDLDAFLTRGGTDATGTPSELRPST